LFSLRAIRPRVVVRKLDSATGRHTRAERAEERWRRGDATAEKGKEGAKEAVRRD
jgi:hypothetical protein